jgi:hypothetical protein
MEYKDEIILVMVCLLISAICALIVRYALAGL